MFAGIGGIDLGFQQAGFEIKWANENDKNASKTYRENFSHKIYDEDVRLLNPKNLSKVDVITSEFENIPAKTLDNLSTVSRPKGKQY